VPVADPHEPHRRFSNFWLAACAALVLALPVAYRACATAATRSKVASIQRECVKYRAIDEKSRRASQALAAAKEAVESERALQAARTEARRPILAFFAVARFFCKNAGGSVALESISQSGSTITVVGTFSDPEDAVLMDGKLMSFTKGNGIRIADYDIDQPEDAEGSVATRFNIVIDCTKFGEAAK